MMILTTVLLVFLIVEHALGLWIAHGSWGRDRAVLLYNQSLNLKQLAEWQERCSKQSEEIKLHR